MISKLYFFLIKIFDMKGKVLKKITKKNNNFKFIVNGINYKINIILYNDIIDNEINYNIIDINIIGNYKWHTSINLKESISLTRESKMTTERLFEIINNAMNNYVNSSMDLFITNETFNIFIFSDLLNNKLLKITLPVSDYSDIMLNISDIYKKLKYIRGKIDKKDMELIILKNKIKEIELTNDILKNEILKSIDYFDYKDKELQLLKDYLDLSKLLKKQNKLIDRKNSEILKHIENGKDNIENLKLLSRMLK